jgi:hypothetical protein
LRQAVKGCPAALDLPSAARLIVAAQMAAPDNRIDLADSLKSSIRQTSDCIDLPTPESRF